MTINDAAVAEPRDILDDIDTVLAEGEPETGYDYGDPTFPMCPRGCGRKWHGMAVTVRIEIMAARGEVDPDYRYSEDDSTVLCPAPDFVGPFQPTMPTMTEMRIYERAMLERHRQQADALLAALGLPSPELIDRALDVVHRDSPTTVAVAAVSDDARSRNALRSIQSAIRAGFSVIRPARGGHIIGPLT